MTEPRKIVIQHPAYEQMVHAARAIDGAAAVKNMPDIARNLISNARSHVRAAQDYLRERDPLARRSAMLCLMIVESTAYKYEIVEGVMTETATITDEKLFTWAVRELHELPAKYQ